LPFTSFTRDWNSYTGWFSRQKDIEKNLGKGSGGMQSVNFHGKIFNFIVYYNKTWQGFEQCEMVVREIRNEPDSKHSPPIYWKLDVDNDKYSLLADGQYYIQQSRMIPAPVVYNDTLYLFFQGKGGLGYTIFNESTRTWSTPVTYADKVNSISMEFASATVINDKLCLVSRSNSYHQIQFTWTTNPKDPYSWSHAILLDCYVLYDNGNYQYGRVSLITKNYMKNNLPAQKLQLAYITQEYDARFAEYEFNSSNNLVLLQNIKIDDLTISDDYDFSTVALVQGSVQNDPEHTGNYTQAFLVKNNKDNGYCSYRILRYQLKEGGNWSRREDNLMPQSDPHMWTDAQRNITAVNFSLLPSEANVNTGDIQRYIVLAYRGYDDYDHPLDVVWAKSDLLTFGGDREQNLKDSINQRHFIGFIDGVPPYYKNTPYPSYAPDSLRYSDGDPISEIEFSNEITGEASNSMSFENTNKIKLKIAHCAAEAEFVHGKKTEYSTKYTETSCISREANKEPTKGYVLYEAPILRRTEYYAQDATGILYRVFYFTAKSNYYMDTCEMHGGRTSSDPVSFMTMKTGTQFSLYPGYSWLVSYTAGGKASITASVDKVTLTKNSNKTSVKLSLGLKEFLEVEHEVSVEYETSTTTTVKNEFMCHTRLNEPETDYEVYGLDYDIYMLSMSTAFNATNWWFPQKARYPGQTPWCLTYKVREVDLHNGTKIIDTGFFAASIPYAIIVENGDDSISVEPTVQFNAQSSSLGFNYPNPFRGATKIQYCIGKDDLPTGSESVLVNLQVYDLNGVLISKFINEEKRPGVYIFDLNLPQLKPGVYFYTLRAGSTLVTKKLVVM
ncbi:MAG: T9SS type A sorting domain-containing protein, partial [Bacteroidota bacterium]